MAADHGKKLYAAQPESANGWYVLSHDAEGHGHIDSGDGGLEEPDARRLAASWNACQLMSIEFLESVPAHTLKSLLVAVNEREALLRALKAITPFMPKSSWANRYRAVGRAADAVREAIAMAEKS